MNCEKCGSPHDGSYGSGRFCCSKCARSFSTKEKRSEVNYQVGLKLRGPRGWTREQLEHFLPSARNWTELARLMDQHPRAIRQMRKMVEVWGLSAEHFESVSETISRLHKEGVKYQGWYKIPEEVLVQDSPCGKNIAKRVFKKLFPERFNKCENCGQTPIWNGAPLVLQIDHINGNSNDNRVENLRVLCPNCHSQTDTFSGRNLRRK